MKRPLRYQVPAALVCRGLKLPAVDHLPDAAVRNLEDPGGLAGGIGLLLHMGSIPLPVAFVPSPIAQDRGWRLLEAVLAPLLCEVGLIAVIGWRRGGLQQLGVFVQVLPRPRLD